MAEKTSATTEIERFECSHCTKVLTRKSNLKRHELVQHKWDIETQQTATDEQLAAIKPKKPKIESTTSNLQEDLLGSISDDSEWQTVEPADVIIVPADESGAHSSSDSDDSDSSASTPVKQPDPTKRIVTKTKVTAPPARPVQEGVKPCQRKLNELTQRKTPVSKVITQLQKAGTSKPASALMVRTAVSKPAVATITKPNEAEAIARAQKWPDRSQLPPILDIFAYQDDLSPSYTPQEISMIAARRFRWSDAPILSSAGYVQAVLMGRNHAQRALLSDVQKYLNEPPQSYEDAQHKWKMLGQWVKTQNKPPTPDQPFQD